MSTTLAATTLALMLAIAGCGGGSDDSNDAADAAPASTDITG